MALYTEVSVLVKLRPHHTSMLSVALMPFQLVDIHKRRLGGIHHCVDQTKAKIQDLSQARNTTSDTSPIKKQLRKEQTKVS